MFLSMFRQLWVFHCWRRTNVYSQVGSKKATKECRSFASITTRTLKWSITYYLTKPDGSNNNKGNEAAVQDLPFLSNSCRAGAVATLNPQPDTSWTHAVGEHSLVPPYAAAYCLFISPLRTMWAWLSDTQELCPNDLISLDRQDLDQALTSTATAALSALHICRPTSRCSSEHDSFVGRERNREREGTESWGGEVWRRMVGEAFRKNVKDILMGCTEGKI